MMKINYRNKLFVVLFSAIYLSSILYFFIDDNYFALLVPFCLSVVLLPIFSFKNIFFPLIFLTPLSIPLSEILDVGLGEMALPTEPMLFGLLLLTCFQMAYRFSTFKPIFSHPITVSIFIYLFWMFITCFMSTLPMISFKYFLSKLWFIIPIIFMGPLLFRNPKFIHKFIMLYTIPLSLVVIYTIIKHSGHNFDKQSAHYMMAPFFKDHTSYGAIIAFFLPLTITLSFIKRHHFLMRIFLLGIIIIMLIGLTLSFTRAAWLSLVIAIVIAIILKFRINRKILFSSPLIVLICLFVFKDNVLGMLENNTQNTSDNLLEHVTSMSNISTDASNVERINRWHCALYMFYDEPMYGFGPGTYQFKYAPYQLLKYYTVIRTNTGQGGNAHSEYLGPLCESGVLGLLSFILMVLVIMIRAINMYYDTTSKTQRTWILALIISLSSYFLHGFFNNFLDTDKAAVAIWISVSILLSFDLFYKKKLGRDSVFDNKIS